ncbi:MAG: Uma2 family endonuclease [Cytophagales bacterium]
MENWVVLQVGLTVQIEILYLYGMGIIIESPPRTIMEVYEMLPGGTLAELIESQIYMSPAPSFYHRDIVFEISTQIRKYLKDNKLGKLVIAPFDVKLDEMQNTVQPDIVVILKTNPSQIDREGRYQGIPDLLIEVLSPSNREYDLIKKKDLYQKFGVQEYWIVDPDTKLALGFALNNKSYNRISEEIGKIRSPLLNAEFEF